MNIKLSTVRNLNKLLPGTILDIIIHTTYHLITVCKLFVEEHFRSFMLILLTGKFLRLFSASANTWLKKEDFAEKRKLAQLEQIHKNFINF